MHLLDLIFVSLLLPCIGGEPTTNCDDIKVENSDLLFYGQNVTITFKHQRIGNEEPQLYVDNKQLQIETIYNNSTQTFTLTLFNATQELHQRHIRVKYGTCATNWKLLNFKGHLTRPRFESKQSIDTCRECVISTSEHPSKQHLGISCSVPSNENVGVNVTITINNVTTTSNKSDRHIYTANYGVQDFDHLSLVACTATFFVDTQRLTMQDKATLYVVKPPTHLQLINTVWNPRSDSRPGCVSRGGRPAPTLHLYYGDIRTKDISNSTFDETSRTFTSTIYLRNATDISQLPVKILCYQTNKFYNSTQTDGVITYTNETTGIHTDQVDNKPDMVTDFQSTTVPMEMSKRTVSTIRLNTTQATPQSKFLNKGERIRFVEDGVLNSSAENAGSQHIIIAVVCAVSVLMIVIAVVIAVVCVKRKRRTLANVSVKDTQRAEQLAQEEGYASIEGTECQYAVVNKPKKLSTPQANPIPPVENIPIEILSQPKKPLGAGEFIYADLDKEALTAKPSNSKPAGTLETPMEYVGIDFARTVALQDANKQEE